jgi:mTERF domain-containing protein
MPSIVIHHPALAESIVQISANVLSTEQWFSRYLNLSKADTAKLKSKWPNDNHLENLGRHRLKHWFAYFLSDIGLTNTELRKMIVSRPTLLSYKLSKIQFTSSFFCEEAGLSKAEFRSIILSYPAVLTYSITNRLRPHISFLQNEIGGGKENWQAWRKVVCTYPQFFSHSLEKTLLPKLNFFCDKKSPLYLKRSELSQVVAKFPPTLWLSDSILKEKFEYLTDSLKLSSKDLKTVILTFPQILGLSIENNLKPKFAFLLGDQEDGYVCDDEDFDCVLSKEELREFVIYQPALLAYSLERRLKPRLNQMEDTGIAFRYCPKNIMSYTDEKFESWYVLRWVCYLL